MESAIDAHLKCPRTRTRRVEDDFQPPYPAFSARAPQSMTQVVMGYFGVQSRGGGEALEMAFYAVNALFDLPDGPGHRDIVRYVDGDGYDTAIAVAYWGDSKQFSRWIDPQNQAWWNADERLRDGVGYFREIVSPRDVQYETAYSSPNHLEGVGVIMGGVSGEILEHGYWGSMRDRIPLSQTDRYAVTRNCDFRPTAEIPRASFSWGSSSAVLGWFGRESGHNVRSHTRKPAAEHHDDNMTDAHDDHNMMTTTTTHHTDDHHDSPRRRPPLTTTTTTTTTANDDHHDDDNHDDHTDDHHDTTKPTTTTTTAPPQPRPHQRNGYWILTTVGRRRFGDARHLAVTHTTRSHNDATTRCPPRTDSHGY